MTHASRLSFLGATSTALAFSWVLSFSACDTHRAHDHEHYRNEGLDRIELATGDHLDVNRLVANATAPSRIGEPSHLLLLEVVGADVSWNLGSLTHTARTLRVYEPDLKAVGLLNYEGADVANWTDSYPSIDFVKLDASGQALLGITAGMSATILVTADDRVSFVTRGLLSRENKNQLLRRFLGGVAENSQHPGEPIGGRPFVVGREVPKLRVLSRGETSRSDRELATLPGANELLVYVPADCSHCQLRSVAEEFVALRDAAANAGVEFSCVTGGAPDVDLSEIRSVVGDDTSVLAIVSLDADPRPPVAVRGASGPLVVWCSGGFVAGVHALAHFERQHEILRAARVGR